MKEELTTIWKALADPSRRAILDLLRERPRTTGELCAVFQVSRFATMKHLTVLEKAGLIIVKREGRERWNYLNAIPLQQMYERWLKPYEAQWATAILRMKQYVETTEERENAMSEQTIAKPALSSMHIEMEVSIKATPERIFKAITQDIAAWWDKDKCTYKHGKMILESELGGRFYEEWGDGEGALFGTVAYIEKNKILEIDGPSGLDRPAQSLVRYELVPQGELTLLKFTHQAYGEFTENTELLFTNGWKDMLQVRLPAYLEQDA